MKLTHSQAPLFSADGKVAFFIGGQINCSTTIHSNVDIMRILSTSSDVEEEKEVRPPLPRSQSSTFRKKGFLKAFGTRTENTPISPSAGMEQKLLNRIEGRDLQEQMNEFYSAYSKVSTCHQWIHKGCLTNRFRTVHRGQI